MSAEADAYWDSRVKQLPPVFEVGPHLIDWKSFLADTPNTYARMLAAAGMPFKMVHAHLGPASPEGDNFTNYIAGYLILTSPRQYFRYWLRFFEISDNDVSLHDLVQQNTAPWVMARANPDEKWACTWISPDALPLLNGARNYFMANVFGATHPRRPGKCSIAMNGFIAFTENATE